MFSLSFEDLIRSNKSKISFDQDFFDFSDRLYPWTTIYRFFFLSDLLNKTQFMLGVGQKRASEYRVNGRRTEFKNDGSELKMAVSYWCEDGGLTHQTKNELVDISEGMYSKTFSFKPENSGYTFSVADMDLRGELDDSKSKTDYVKFSSGLSPFYRHNKYMPFKGRIKGREVQKGFAFIQKVYLNMPFIPWRWARVFFENGAQFDFYEPRILVPLFRSVNFENGGEKIEFKMDSNIILKGSSWTVSGKARTGERLEARIRSYSKVRHTFETPRSTFVYNEMPSELEHFTIKLGGETVHSEDSLGECVANCEDAYYSRIAPLSRVLAP